MLWSQVNLTTGRAPPDRKKVQKMTKIMKIFIFSESSRNEARSILSYQSVINADLNALRCISLNFNLIKEKNMIFVILLMSMRILLAHARIQKFKKYCNKQRHSWEDLYCFRKRRVLCTSLPWIDQGNDTSAFS